MTRLEGAIAVVTGGGSGIGLGIVRALRANGSTVIIADIDPGAAETATAAGAHFIRLDVSDDDSVRALHDETIARFGHVDIIVNNAGVGPEASIARMSIDDWRWLLDINLWGVIRGVAKFLPGMLERGTGHIVNISSMSALAPMPPLGGYAVTKAGVSTLTEVLWSELEGTGVAATLVVPGPTRSQIGSSLRHRPHGDDGALREFRNTPPADLWREADEVGELIADALRDERRLVVTHPRLWPRVSARHDTIAAAFADAAARDGIA